MADRSVAVILRANITDFKNRMREAQQAVRDYAGDSERSSQRADTALSRMARSARDNSAAWTNVGMAVGAFGAIAAVGVGKAIKTFADFDAAMSNVQAATGESAGAMESLRAAALKAGADTAFSATEAADGIEQLAKAGVSTADILGGGLAGALDLAAAGQVGVGEAAEYAASAMTQFNLNGSDVTHIADLLAAGAGKAQGGVSDLGQALAQSGLVASQTGLTIEETTGALAAFAEAGLIGSDAGTSFKTMLQRLTAPSGKAAELMDELGVNAYDAQGQFVGLAEFAGDLRGALEQMTPAQRNAALATIFGTDAVRAAAVIYKQGESGIRGWINNVNDSGYAAEQAAARLDNLKGDLESLGGAIETALIGAGSGSDGVLRGLTQRVEALVNVFNDLPPAAQQTTLAVGGVAGAAGLAGGAALIAVPRVVELYDSLGKLGGAGATAQRGMRGVASVLTGPWGIALGAGVLALGAYAESQYKADRFAADLSDTLDDQTGAVTDNTRAFVAKRLEDEGVLKAAQTLGLNLEDVTQAMLGNSAAQARVNEELGRWQGMADVASAAGMTLSDMYGTVSTDAQSSLTTVNRALGGYNAAIDTAVASATRQQEALGGQTEKTDEYGEVLDSLPSSQAAAAEGEGQVQAALAATDDQLTATQERLKEWREDMASTVESFVEPLDVYDKMLADKEEAERESAEATAESTKDASDSWEDHVGDVDVSLGEYAAALRKQNQAQDKWRDNLVTITKRGGTEVARILAGMGAEGADLTDKMANATGADFDRMRRELIRDAQFGRRGVVDEIAIMERLGRAGAKDTADGIARELGVGADAVRRIASRYSINLAEGVNPLLTAIGRQKVAVSRAQQSAADGRTRSGYADGGFEDHSAQIAQGQTPFRVWAEPETGGEAYIPLAESKRSRSLAIWRETGKRLGVENPALTEMFADGGFTSAADVPKPPGTGKYRPPLSTAGGGTMDHAYDETRDWVDANAAMTGVAGIGSAGGSGGRGWQWQMAVLRRVFPGLPLNSGYRPGAITALGNRSMHGMGRAVDVPPRPEVFNWIKANYGASTKQLFFSPLGAILNGRPWNMDSTTRSGHYDHIHWGYRDGGFYEPGSPLNPHVRDGGGPLLPGFTYNGTGRNETVVSGAAGGAAPTIAADVRVFVGDRELTDIVRVEVDHVSNAARDRLQYAGTH